MNRDLVYRHIESQKIVNTTKIYRSDVIHERKLEQPRSRVGGGIRGKSTPYSRQSRARLAFYIRNVAPLAFFLTLTYAKTFPVEAETIRDHQQRVCRWLRESGISYVWVLEYQKRGAPHFHLLLDKEPDRQELTRFWCGLAGIRKAKHRRRCVYLEPIHTWEGTVAYLSRYKATQRRVPDNIVGNLGNWWGHTRALKAEPIHVVSDQADGNNGDFAALDVARTARRLEEHKRKEFGARPRKDNGLFSFKTWGTGPAILAMLEKQSRGAGQAEQPAPVHSPRVEAKQMTRAPLAATYDEVESKLSVQWCMPRPSQRRTHLLPMASSTVRPSRGPPGWAWWACTGQVRAP